MFGLPQTFCATCKPYVWSTRTATVASNGTFVTRWRVTRRSHFVAQALGTADHAGVGTKPLAVDLKRPKK